MKKIFMLVLIIGAVVCGILVNSEGSVSGMYPVYTPDPVAPRPTMMMPVCVHVGSVPVVTSTPEPVVVIPVVATPKMISRNNIMLMWMR